MRRTYTEGGKEQSAEENIYKDDREKCYGLRMQTGFTGLE
jgi:hypothetical protein